jgi:hypothetical protein
LSRECKIEKENPYYFMITTEKSGSDLELATGDPDVWTFDLRAPFIYLSLSLPPHYFKSRVQTVCNMNYAQTSSGVKS